MKLLLSLRDLTICFSIISIGGLTACSNNSSTGSTTGADSANSTKGDTMNSMKMSSDSMPMQKADHAEAMLSGTFADTTVDGTVKFDQESNGKVKMTLEITIPKKANKSVAVHIHEHGDCGDTAKMAHGHWNPTGAQHGKWGSASFHSGDIGNVSLDAKGKGHMELETDLWSLGVDAKTNILGRSIIVHGGVDDYKSQPTGNSGTRIGCGVIK